MLATIDSRRPRELVQPTQMGVLLCHPGTQHSFKLAVQLERLGVLEEFWTSIAIRENSLLHRGLSAVLPVGLSSAIGHRTIGDISEGHLRQRRVLEAKFFLDRILGRAGEVAFNRKCRLLQARIPQSSIQRSSHVIGFDCSSWILAERARASAKPYVLERTAPHPDAHAGAVRSVVQRYGQGWFDQIKPAEIRSIELHEHDLASKIVVASNFSRRTLVLSGIDDERIAVNPYGVDARAFAAGHHRRPADRVRFLFVGTLSALKGIPVLLEAWSALPAGAASLGLVGRAEPQVLARIPSDGGITVFGKRSHDELPALMAQHDVFVFPSHFDGFGLVILEAMASGLPVIATSASAGPDLINEGKEGFVVPAGDPESLANRMRHFIDNPEDARRMGTAARKRAETFTWDRYGDRWAGILKSIEH